jgi:hypothetical protein
VEAVSFDGGVHKVETAPAPKLLIMPFDEMAGFHEDDGIGLWVFPEERFPAFDMVLADFRSRRAYLAQLTVTKPFDNDHKKKMQTSLSGGYENRT